MQRQSAQDSSSLAHQIQDVTNRHGKWAMACWPRGEHQTTSPQRDAVKTLVSFSSVSKHPPDVQTMSFVTATAQDKPLLHVPAVVEPRPMPILECETCTQSLPRPIYLDHLETRSRNKKLRFSAEISISSGPCHRRTGCNQKSLYARLLGKFGTTFSNCQAGHALRTSLCTANLPQGHKKSLAGTARASCELDRADT